MTEYILWSEEFGVLSSRWREVANIVRQMAHRAHTDDCRRNDEMDEVERRAFIKR